MVQRENHPPGHLYGVHGVLIMRSLCGEKAWEAEKMVKEGVGSEKSCAMASEGQTSWDNCCLC